MVAVYCASGPVPERYLDLAAEVGEEIGRRGWGLVSGGGNVSMMGVVARAAREAGAWTVGVIPKALVHREVADTEADELIVVDTMRQRKKKMEDRADAFVALPGGIGTLDEFFEAWTVRSLDMHTKPVVMLDPDGHYDLLLRWLREAQSKGFVHPRSMGLLSVATDVGAALDLCEGGR